MLSQGLQYQQAAPAVFPLHFNVCVLQVAAIRHQHLASVQSSLLSSLLCDLQVSEILRDVMRTHEVKVTRNTGNASNINNHRWGCDVASEVPSLFQSAATK
eukprot:4278989-Pleurochrysis_carterae.AAC.2